MTPARTFLLVVEYDGTNYFGFQRQEGTDRDSGAGPPPKKARQASTNSSVSGRAARRAGAPPITIQDQLETALVRLTGNTLAQLRVRGAGRTDKGVHATGQVVAFDYHHQQSEDDADGKSDDGEAKADAMDSNGAKGRKKEKQAQHQDTSLFQHASPSEELWQIRRAINSRLPKDIAVRSCRLMPPPPPGGKPFEARHDVQNKRYTYRLRFHRRKMVSIAGDKGGPKMQVISPICLSGQNTLRSAHDPSNMWICPWALDENLIQKVCHLLQGQHDFSSFVVKCDRSSRNNTIYLKRFSVSFKDVVEDEDEDAGDIMDNSDDTSIPCNATFVLEAGGFRRQMVRRLIGFVVDVARGHCSLDNIDETLKGSDEAAQQVHAAPACGLTLSKVEYKILAC